MMAISYAAISMQVRFRRRLVKEFTYDGHSICFRTLGAAIKTRGFSDIGALTEWRGRGKLLGYRLKFRDGQTIYLQCGVANAVMAARRIWNDLDQ
jgi:hypothetical protein